MDKWLYLILGIVVVGIIGVLWSQIGGAAMALLFFAVVYLFSVTFTYALGRSHEAEAMKNGAQIALTAQKSDDTRDIAQMSALGKLFKEMLPVLRQMQADGQTQTQAQPPALPFPAMGGGADWVDGKFTINGFDDEEGEAIQ